MFNESPENMLALSATAPPLNDVDVSKRSSASRRDMVSTWADLEALGGALPVLDDDDEGSILSAFSVLATYENLMEFLIDGAEIK